tara:strand:+ start:605 stop:1039 length:435 start_codon:yes stop_codon:yes gene_type:complete
LRRKLARLSQIEGSRKNRPAPVPQAPQPPDRLQLPTSWITPNPRWKNLGRRGYEYRIDTGNLQDGDLFHIHIRNRRGVEIAVIQGRPDGTTYWRRTHGDSDVVLHNRQDVDAKVRHRINYITRHAKRAIWGYYKEHGELPRQSH